MDETFRGADPKPESDLEAIEKFKIRNLDEKPESDLVAIARL